MALPPDAVVGVGAVGAVVVLQAAFVAVVDQIAAVEAVSTLAVDPLVVRRVVQTLPGIHYRFRLVP